MTGAFLVLFLLYLFTYMYRFVTDNPYNVYRKA